MQAYGLILRIVRNLTLMTRGPLDYIDGLMESDKNENCLLRGSIKVDDLDPVILHLYFDQLGFSIHCSFSIVPRS